MEIQIKPNTETKYKIKVDFMDVKSILILYLELHTFKSMVNGYGLLTKQNCALCLFNFCIFYLYSYK